MGGAGGTPEGLSKIQQEGMAGINGSRGDLANPWPVTEGKDIYTPPWAGGDLAGKQAEAAGFDFPGWLASMGIGTGASASGGLVNSQGLNEATTGSNAQPATNAAPEPAATTANLGLPSQYSLGAGAGIGGAATPGATTSGVGVMGGVLAGPATPTTPAATGLTPEQVRIEAQTAAKDAEARTLAAQQKATADAAAQRAADQKAQADKASEWVSVNLPDSFHANQSNLFAAQQQPGTYNYGGVYTPKNLSQTNMADFYGQGATRSGFAPGTTLTGADAENQPRMRRALYDFNMQAYGNPYGPGGGGQGQLAWWMGQPSQPGSFFMGGGG